MPIAAVLTPHDNFSERSTTHFGVGELIDLSITNPAHTTAASLGGLRWFISKGGGTLAGAGNNGQALFTAPASAGSVTLVLKVVSGGDSGKIVASTTITIIEPQGAKMVQQPGTGILHVNDTWSCAFIGDVYLLPASVSFANVMIREASVPAAASGFLAQLNGQLHEVGPLCSIGPGNSVTGCKVNMVGDKVSTGVFGPPYSDGDFLWDIPWEFTVGGSSLRAFTRIQHRSTADANGTAAIAKGGAGPFSKVPSDSTTGF